MKNLTCTCVGVVFVLGETFGSLSLALADDPPPLEAPALAAPGTSGPVAGDPRPDIRRDGPPADMPADAPGPAPGPDFFYVPGQYVPSGGGVAWKPGFWARSQPGWEWVPARWVRLSQGWSYREGHWERAELGPGAPAPPRRHVVARPAPGPFSRDTARDVAGPVDPNPATELAPLPDNGPAAPPSEGRPPAPRLPGPGDPNPSPDPRFAAPLVPLVVPPITELDLPGVHIRVVPPVPWVGAGVVAYPGVVVPPVQVRVRPLREVRQRIRELIDAALP